MTWLIWNIRGLNKRHKQKEIKQYIKEKHYKLAGLVETKVKEDKAEKMINRIVPNWSRITNYEHAVNGRVWIIWDDHVYTIQPLDKHDQFIHCLVTGKQNGMCCYLTVVYGHNDSDKRRNLWEQLKRIAQNITGPWLIGGDFNAILYAQDRLSKVPVKSTDIKEFVEYCHDIGVAELPWKGEYFTWTNKQQ